MDLETPVIKLRDVLALSLYNLNGQQDRLDPDRMLFGTKSLPNDCEIYPCRDWNRGGLSRSHFL
jgi:hypothetical protein